MPDLLLEHGCAQHKGSPAWGCRACMDREIHNKRKRAEHKKKQAAEKAKEKRERLKR